MAKDHVAWRPLRLGGVAQCRDIDGHTWQLSAIVGKMHRSRESGHTGYLDLRAIGSEFTNWMTPPNSRKSIKDVLRCPA